jgi:hypothetical protein
MNPHSTVLCWIKAGGDRPRYHIGPSLREDSSMLDVLMVALALGFFALSVGYAYACDRL